MNVIKRFLIVIWTIVFVCSIFCGGFILYPILRYIFCGELDDIDDTCVDIYDYVKDGIEKVFDGLSNIKNYKSNGQFWK